MSRQIKRRRADVGEIVAAQPDQRRISHGAAFLIELLVLPLNAHIGIGAFYQQLFGKFQSRQIAGRDGRALRRVAHSLCTVRAGFAEPGERV